MSKDRRWLWSTQAYEFWRRNSIGEKFFHVSDSEEKKRYKTPFRVIRSRLTLWEAAKDAQK